MTIRKLLIEELTDKEFDNFTKAQAISAKADNEMEETIPNKDVWNRNLIILNNCIDDLIQLINVKHSEHIYCGKTYEFFYNDIFDKKEEIKNLLNSPFNYSLKDLKRIIKITFLIKKIKNQFKKYNNQGDEKTLRNIKELLDRIDTEVFPLKMSVKTRSN
jgi:hypothetical protein